MKAETFAFEPDHMRDLAGGHLHWHGPRGSRFDLSLLSPEAGWAVSCFGASHPEQLLMRSEGFSQQEDMVTLMVMLDGRLSSKHPEVARPLRMQAGSLCIYRLQEHAGCTRYQGTQTCCVSVMLRMDCFLALLDAELDADLLALTAQMQAQPAFARQAPASAGLLALARQLQAAMAQAEAGIAARLRSQVLRLQFVAEVVAGLRGHLQREQAKRARWQSQDEALLREAGRSLLAQLQEPPSIAELARQLGLNDCRLKIGFKALFGLGVAAWVREQRLQQAALLLGRPGATVTETALQIGYANPAQFAAAFRKRFDLNPGEWARRSILVSDQDLIIQA
ncbi:AraC-like DNA-binding protein [Paucibacter oligotrophus]|uniref:AraC-like DNA-binding protein n=1 Tax=Roseateles oligotrophus TaxID=1769250 RepID=A0A840LC09_9BURK|nr:AraC family transcriptional regulator [Roseateles oligotrophus]MBB4846154.1 AraC-like DNA-binding protein [Roseateles oligotrophus]